MKFARFMARSNSSMLRAIAGRVVASEVDGAGIVFRSYVLVPRPQPGKVSTQ